MIVRYNKSAAATDIALKKSFPDIPYTCYCGCVSKIYTTEPSVGSHNSWDSEKVKVAFQDNVYHIMYIFFCFKHVVPCDEDTF